MQARRDSIRNALEQSRILYAEDGHYVVQLSAWRSEQKAGEISDLWKSRGFRSSFVQESGDAQTGDLWYRVRIGNFATRDMAERVQRRLRDDYQTTSWVSDLRQDPTAHAIEGGANDPN